MQTILYILVFYFFHKGDPIAEDADDALDARGIPGWGKVDALTVALIRLSGLSVTNSQAKEIKHLYENPHNYHKRPLVFKPRPVKRTRGRFARSKEKRSGHVTVQAMKR